MYDLRGVEIQPGDAAVYSSTGRYAFHAVVQVLEVKRRVRVRVIQASRAEHNNAELWASPFSLVLVESFK